MGKISWLCCQSALEHFQFFPPVFVLKQSCLTFTFGAYKPRVIVCFGLSQGSLEGHFCFCPLLMWKRNIFCRIFCCICVICSEINKVVICIFCLFVLTREHQINCGGPVFGPRQSNPIYLYHSNDTWLIDKRRQSYFPNERSTATHRSHMCTYCSYKKKCFKAPWL